MNHGSTPLEWVPQHAEDVDIGTTTYALHGMLPILFCCTVCAYKAMAAIAVLPILLAWSYRQPVLIR